MSDYSILVRAILDKTNLQEELNKMTSASSKAVKVKASVELDQTQIKAQLDKWSNQLARMGVGKVSIFNTPEVKKDLDTINSLISSFGTKGGSSVAQVNAAFNNLKTTIAVVGQNIKIVDQEQADLVSNQRAGLQLEKEWSSAYDKHISAIQEVANAENKRYDTIAKAQLAATAEEQKRNDALMSDWNTAHAKHMADIQAEAIAENKRYDQLALAQINASIKNKQIDQAEMSAIHAQAIEDNKAWDNKIKMLDQYSNKLLVLQARNKKAFSTPEVQESVNDLKALMRAFDGTKEKTLELQMAMNKLDTNVNLANAKVKNLTKDGMDLGNMFEIAFKKVAVWFGATTLIFGTIQEITKATQYVKDLNKELTNLQIVTGMSNEEAQKTSASYNKLASDMGATTLEVARGSLEWARQGKTVAETQELLQSTLMLSKLGNIDSAQATEYLTSTLNGFKLEASDAIMVVDKLIQLDNNYATSAAEIADALQRSANSAQQAGVTFDQLSSYITVVSSVTRKSSESIGESFKTMFARLENIKLGKMFEDDPTNINDVEKALSLVNIKIRDTENSFRPMGDVIKEVSEKWSVMNELEQSAVANAIAGKPYARTYGDVWKYAFLPLTKNYYYGKIKVSECNYIG